jgi:hypothetical protein
MDLELRGRQVDEPDLANPDPRVERDLDAPIQPKGGVGDLDEQQHVGRLRMAGPVKILPRAKQQHVGLQLAVEPGERDGILDAHMRPIPQARYPQASEAIHRAGMLHADRLTDDDVPMDQLEPVVLGQDAGLAHPVVLLDSEAVPGQQLTHATPPNRSTEADRYPSSRGPAIRPHSNEIIVGDRPNVAYTECEQRLGPTGGGNEFDLETIRLVNLHDSAQVALAKAALWEFSVEDHDVKSPVSHRYPSGYAVTNRGTFSAVRMIQTLTTPAERSAGPTNGARSHTSGHRALSLRRLPLGANAAPLSPPPAGSTLPQSSQGSQKTAP